MSVYLVKLYLGCQWNRNDGFTSSAAVITAASLFKDNRQNISEPMTSIKRKSRSRDFVSKLSTDIELNSVPILAPETFSHTSIGTQFLYKSTASKARCLPFKNRIRTVAGLMSAFANLPDSPEAVSTRSNISFSRRVYDFTRVISILPVFVILYLIRSHYYMRLTRQSLSSAKPAGHRRYHGNSSCV